jgi:hypothetical protein
MQIYSNLAIILEDKMKNSCIILFFIFAFASCNPIENSLIPTLTETTLINKTDLIPLSTTTYTFTPSKSTTVIMKTKSVTKTEIITELTFNPTPFSGSSRLVAFANDESINFSFIDLDSGKHGKDPNSDIAFIVSCGSDCFDILWATNDAKAYYYGMTEPDYIDCLKDSTLFMEGDINQSPDGGYICVKTNLNNLSVLKIIKSFINKDDGAVIKDIYYKIWKR